MADYEFLTVDNIGDHIRARSALAGLINPDQLVDVAEIGDGNLNLVFIAKDAEGKSICLKQALPYVRMVGEGWPMTPDRARHEATSLKAHYELVPDLVVELYDFDPQRHILALADLSDHAVWRGALNNGETHLGAARAVGRYIGALAFGTSVFGLERLDLGASQREAVNPELCEITEDLVFTEPLVDAGRNSVLPANEPDAKALAEDRVFQKAMAEAKWLFMTAGEALLHGDLHTGSVMVKADGETSQVRVFDSEFAFYGPVAFDLGAIWANLVIAAARAFALGEDERAGWLLGEISEVWNGLSAEFMKLWPNRVDPRLWDDEFAAKRLDQWQRQGWLFAAAKMSRRIVGAAKTTDIQTLPEPLREGAARGVLLVARALVSTEPSSPKTLSELAKEILHSARTNK
ncbi:MAG: S-methyl-5-thioribose kinase [Actinomycetales bacterium]|nr:MAG: S-methyl-5-thioribose kinase [Actinomycetales bacterium]